MHYVFAPFGSAGDVHPMLGLACALRDRGHRATLLVNGYFRETVERQGFPQIELGTRDEFLESVNHPDLWHPARAFPHIFRRMENAAIRGLYTEIQKLYVPGETVVVTSCFGFGALAAQEKFGVPVVTLHLQPSVMWSDIRPPRIAGIFGPRWMKSFIYNLGERYVIDPVACPALNRFRAELGLPPVRKITRYWHSPFCVAALFPEWFCSPAPDWPHPLIQTDFPLWDERADEPLAPEVQAFLEQGSPPVVFTPGSANVFGKRFFEAAVAACQKLGRRGILLTRFPEQIPARLPDGVVHYSYVPLTPLLARAAAFVHHGGIGSMAQALAASIPQLIMPLAHDQFDNAERVTQLGVGSSLAQKSFTGPRLVSKLEPLLVSPAVSNACQTAALRMQKDGLTRMATALEKHCAQPVLQ